MIIIKIRFNNDSELRILNGASLEYIPAIIDDNQSFEDILSIVQTEGNMESITFVSDADEVIATISGLEPTEHLLFIDEINSQIVAVISLREKSDSEIATKSYVDKKITELKDDINQITLNELENAVEEALDDGI